MRKWTVDFNTQQQDSNEDVWYDWLDDEDLIDASFRTQYQMSIYDLEWAEYIKLLPCLMPDTPLGQVVAIRSEKDSKVLEHFSPSQKRIRYEWHRKQAMMMSEEQREEAIRMQQEAFLRMFS